MESAIDHLEQSVQKADGKLDMIAWQIDAFEKEFEDSESEPVSVLRLLRSVTQVKEEYQILRQDIQEVQQLQKQLTDSLRAQLLQGGEIGQCLVSYEYKFPVNYEINKNWQEFNSNSTKKSLT